jgi:hypothetical protein
MQLHTLSFAALSLSTALLAGSPALAEMKNMTATLDGAQQVPPVESPGTGMAEITYDTETKMLEWTVEYSGLTEAPTAGHFHGPAAAGETAGVAVPFEGDLASPIEGSATLTAEQETELLAGRYYINLHTPAHPDGEIRGQVEAAM